MKFFNIDLHISVIADIKKIFEDLGHQVDSLCLSGHSWVFNKAPASTNVINQHNWQQINEKICDDFFQAYEKELAQYDGFICTYPPAFSLLYRKFEKPIIVVAATRYEFPFTFDKTRWQAFNQYLVGNKNIIRIANNLFDQHYAELLTNAKWQYIPSLCEYTQASYSPQNDNIILYSKNKSIPNTINKESLGRYTWQSLYQNRGIVHIPYNYSTMSIFEQYTANVPLFFPTKRYLKELFIGRQAMSEISFKQVFGGLPKSELSIASDPNCYHDLAIFDKNVGLADFYNEELMPHITYFDSDEHLQHLINHTAYLDISGKMQCQSKVRKNNIYCQWSNIISSLC